YFRILSWHLAGYVEHGNLETDRVALDCRRLAARPTGRAYRQILLLPPLYHDDVISEAGLGLSILGAGRRARLEGKCHGFKLRTQASPRLPAQRPSWFARRQELENGPDVAPTDTYVRTLPSLVLGELPRHLVEFYPILQLGKGLLLLRELLTLC